MRIVSVLLPLWTVLLPSFSPQEPKYEMTTFHLILYSRGPSWSEASAAEHQRLVKEHADYLLSLRNSGKYVIGGALQSDSTLREILVLQADSLPAARSLAEADPAARAGLFRVEALNWWAAKGIMKPPQRPIQMVTYYWGFLVKGEKWTPDRTPELDSLQARHLAHMNKSAESGKLVIAGPADGSQTIRGILVYKTATIAEAQAIANADPAVKAGRLKLEIYPWLIERGCLP